LSKTGTAKRKSQERGRGRSARAPHLHFRLAVEQLWALALAPGPCLQLWRPPAGSPSLEGVLSPCITGKSQLGKDSDVGSADVHSYAM